MLLCKNWKNGPQLQFFQQLLSWSDNCTGPGIYIVKCLIRYLQILIVKTHDKVSVNLDNKHLTCFYSKVILPHKDVYAFETSGNQSGQRGWNHSTVALSEICQCNVETFLKLCLHMLCLNINVCFTNIRIRKKCWWDLSFWRFTIVSFLEVNKKSVYLL